MARKDWYYPNIPIEMAEALDKIVADDTRIRKYGISNKADLITSIIADFIEKYEETHNVVTARRSVRTRDKDLMRPLS